MRQVPAPQVRHVSPELKSVARPAGRILPPPKRLVSDEFMAKKAEVLGHKPRIVSPKIKRAYAKSIYGSPVPMNAIMYGATDRSPAHVGANLYCLDLYVPEKTPVFATADGVVAGFKDSWEGHGIDLRYYNRGNWVELRHPHGEWTTHEHLAHGSVVVQRGQRVHRGEIIAYSGNTGFTENPHVHFGVLVSTNGRLPLLTNYRTVIPRFEDPRLSALYDVHRT